MLYTTKSVQEIAMTIPTCMCLHTLIRIYNTMYLYMKTLAFVIIVQLRTYHYVYHNTHTYLSHKVQNILRCYVSHIEKKPTNTHTDAFTW